MMDWRRADGFETTRRRGDGATRAAPATTSPETMRLVYADVGPLSARTSAAHVREIFNAASATVTSEARATNGSAREGRARASNATRTYFARVGFASEGERERAMARMDGGEIDGRTVRRGGGGGERFGKDAMSDWGRGREEHDRARPRNDGLGGRRDDRDRDGGVESRFGGGERSRRSRSRSPPRGDRFARASRRDETTGHRDRGRFSGGSRANAGRGRRSPAPPRRRSRSRSPSRRRDERPRSPGAGRDRKRHRRRSRSSSRSLDDDRRHRDARDGRDGGRRRRRDGRRRRDRSLSSSLESRSDSSSPDASPRRHRRDGGGRSRHRASPMR